MRDHTARDAQILVFPGHCAAALKRLGAPCDKIMEAQFAVSDPDNVAVERRNVTTLALSDHDFSFGANITEVAAPLEAAVELVLEVDERWSMQRIGDEMEKDPRATMARMASTLTHKALEPDMLYQYREHQQKPLRVWLAKIRIAAPLGEKLVCASGREALFVRPSIPAMLPANDLYTIIWSKRHDQASPSLLAELLQRADRVQAHRGLAHSIVAVGLRAPWTGIEQARKVFSFDDPRFQEETYGLKDVYQYVLEGVPPHAEAGDLATFLKCAGWKAIPHRRRIVRGAAHWRVSAAEAPPEKLYKWQNTTIVIRLALEEEITRKTKNPKKQGQQKSESKQMMKTVVDNQVTDPVFAADPWRGHKSRQSAPSQSDAPADSSARSASSALMDSDPRLQSLVQRMSIAEERHSQLEERVDRVDGKLDKLNLSMDEKFEKVMHGLAGLSASMDDQRKEKIPRIETAR